MSKLNPTPTLTPTLTIVASIRAMPGKVELVRGELEKLVPITRAEAGCLQYDLHQDNEDPAHFLFFENWESRELWQQHMQAPHLAAYKRVTDGAIGEFKLRELSQIV